MDEKELLKLLRRPEAAPGKRGWHCPDESRLAAHVEHRLSPQEEEYIQSHLADCSYCLDQVDFLLRRPTGEASEVPAQILLRARNLVAPKPKSWCVPAMRWGTIAAAACLVLVVALQLSPPSVPSLSPAPALHPPAQIAQPATPKPEPSVAGPQAMRNSKGKPVQLKLLSPANDSSVSAEQLEFRWRAIPGSAYYEINVVTAEGNVVWQGKVEGTQARLPAGTALEAGQQYFVWLRAYLSGGESVKAEAISFRIAVH